MSEHCLFGIGRRAGCDRRSLLLKLEMVSRDKDRVDRKIRHLPGIRRQFSRRRQGRENLDHSGVERLV